MRDEKRVSVKDIASALHISLSTVHKALTGKPGISEARRQQVLQAAQEMGYCVNTAAQILSRKQMTLAILLPGQWQEFFSQMKLGISRQLEALESQKVRGIYYEIPPIPAPQEASRLREWLQQEAPEAVLYCASHYTLNSLALEVLTESGCPFFWVGGSLEQPESICNITIDGSRAGQLAADFLSCVRGRELQAAVFTGSMKIPVHRAKTEAFLRRLENRGIPAPDVYQTEDDPEKTRAAFESLLKARPAVNAIYVSTATSEPICKMIEERNLSEQITLLGTDLYDTLAVYMKKGIMKATINQNQEEVGSLAVRTAYEYLHKTSTYGSTQWRPERQLPVKPSLLLLADIE